MKSFGKPRARRPRRRPTLISPRRPGVLGTRRRHDAPHVPRRGFTFSDVECGSLSLSVVLAEVPVEVKWTQRDHHRAGSPGVARIAIEKCESEKQRVARRNTQRVRRGRCGGRCTPLRTHCDPLRTTSEPPLPAAFCDGFDVQSPSFLAGCARTRSHRPTKAKTEHLNALMMHRRNGRSRRVSAPGPPRGAAERCARTAPPARGARTAPPPRDPLRRRTAA